MSKNEILELLDQAKGLIEKDPNEAGIMLYKAAEKSMIILAAKHVQEVYKEANEKGSWGLFQLFKVAEELSKKLDKKIKKYWYEAWELRVESKQYGLRPEFLRNRIKDIEKLVSIALKNG
ncbi:MAG TPA: PaREP1 family protein [Geobacterales bacterium]|nr:PaREP1 family protein [Geobacterales bacterium]